MQWTYPAALHPRDDERQLPVGRVVIEEALDNDHHALCGLEIQTASIAALAEERAIEGVALLVSQ